MDKDVVNVLEKRISGNTLSSCLREASEWLKKEEAPDFFIEGIFLWEDKEFFEWCINIYYTKGYYK